MVVDSLATGTMRWRRFLRFLMLTALGSSGAGCTARLLPDHVTASCEGDSSEASGPHKQRTTTGKVGLSATYDLSGH